MLKTKTIINPLNEPYMTPPTTLIKVVPYGMNDIRMNRIENTTKEYTPKLIIKAVIPVTLKNSLNTFPRNVRKSMIPTPNKIQYVLLLTFLVSVAIAEKKGTRYINLRW